MLVSVKKLYEQLLGNSDHHHLLIIDARSFNEYAEGHIPGAVNLDLFAFHWLDTSIKGIKEFNNQTKKLFSFAGVDSTKKVVFYDNVSGMLAARGVWLLRYFSHPESYMLDGGFTKWMKDNLPVEQKTNPFIPSTFDGVPNPSLIATHKEILDELDNARIIDARSKDEYDGKIIRAAKDGHIPYAINIDWNENIDSNGLLKNSTELERVYKNIPKEKDTKIITYCQGAYRAANTFVALKKIGFKNVKVYLGSWGEWGNKEELPVEK